jgi:DNA excision repair protein ERCC-2
VLFCVARGKISEGIDFDHQYGRTVLCIGVPFQNTESRIVKARLTFLRENYNIKENDFLSFDAMRHAAQCLGRVLRGKDDYGIMVLADRRFRKKRNQLPRWIQQYLPDSETNLSVDQAAAKSRKFLCDMSEPWSRLQHEGVDSWDLEDLKHHQEKDAEDEQHINMQNILLTTTNGMQVDGFDTDIDDQDLIDTDVS